MDDKPVITSKTNGPLTVKDLEHFQNSRGENIEVKPVMALCRCGASKRKPFCDGSHARIGFDDKKSTERVDDRLDTYQGEKIIIYDNRGVCSHAGYCTANLPEVFHMGTEPWIDPNGADPAELRRVIDMCPSGALAYARDGRGTGEETEEPGIQVSLNGPYLVKGGVELAGADLGQGVPKDHYTLCRCGKSGNKPRCDGSHWYAGFQDDEALTISAANRTGKAEPKRFKVAEPGALEEGGMLSIEVANRQMVISRIDGKYYAVQGVCPHQGGPLGQGRIDNKVLRCPWHGHPFDPRTGKSLADDPDLEVYTVQERDDGVYIEVDEPDKPGWTVGHLIAETMVNWGITHVFGMVGHSNLGLAEGIRVQVEKNKLNYIGVRHEGTAAFACSAFAKVSGGIAACLTIAGPGATNLLTGLWDAKMDRAPVLALTGQIDTHFIGPGAFQEVDLRSAFASVADFSKTVLPGSDHAELVSLALKHAIVNRDVAHLIVPDDVQGQDAGIQAPGRPEGRLAETAIKPPDQSVDMAMYRINRAKRPVVIVGYGARNAMDRIMELAGRLNAPVLTTFKAKGQIPDHHPLACGVLGKSGTPVSSWFMNNSDLLIVFGASFSRHTGIDKNKPIVQVDFDRMALGRFHPVHSPIWGDVGETVSAILERLPASAGGVDCRNEIAERWSMWRTEKTRRAAMTGDNGLNSALVMEALSRIAPKRALFCVDVGNNTYSFGRYFECDDNRVIMCGYLGSIGFALPAAIGASQAGSGRPIVALGGDGGFGQYMGDFSTAVRHNLDITSIVLNNGELGKISQEQRDAVLPVWQTGLTNPGFAEFARDCGGFGVRVDSGKDLGDALSKAFAYKGPSLVEIITDPILT
ncbi:MAG: Rieske 2Fe-2S domain-containing protein [Deltaproteobacteria bacterium]|nr:Rieske 2Fe-2S domain-containing protein [Deltaproteobacteria bacterium]